MKNKTLLIYPEKIDVWEFIETMLPYPRCEILTYNRMEELFPDIIPEVYEFDYEKQKAIDLLNTCHVQVGNLLWVDNEDELFTIDIDEIKESCSKVSEVLLYKNVLSKRLFDSYPEYKNKIDLTERIFFTDKLKQKYNHE